MTIRDELAALELRLESCTQELHDTADPERKKLLAEMLELLIDKYRNRLDNAIMSREYS